MDHLMTGLAMLTVVLVLLPLGAIFAYLIYKGAGSINWAFLTQTPKPVGEPGGGMANAIVGSMVILAIASLMSVPLGIGAGIYLSEYGRNRYGDIVRFVSDVLNGVPSIVIGIVAYGLVVLRQGHFSAFAGGVALAIMMVPKLAQAVLEMDHVVDRMRDEAFIMLVRKMNESPEVTQQALDALLVARNLERVADHATNIAEDVIFWVLGADVRHHAQSIAIQQNPE